MMMEDSINIILMYIVECKTHSGSLCFFPFSYDGQPHQHYECLVFHEGGSPFCHTDNSGWSWSSCSSDCPGNIVMYVKCSYNLVKHFFIEACYTPCQFPFTYNGKVHDACITHDNTGTPWCEHRDTGEKRVCAGTCPGIIVLTFSYYYSEE